MMSGIKLPKRLKVKLSESHRRAPKLEREIENKLKISLTPGSGNKHIKADVRVNGVVRVECKTTKHSSFSVNKEHIRKIIEAVNGTTEMPVMVIELELGSTKFVVVPYEYFDYLVAERKDYGST